MAEHIFGGNWTESKLARLEQYLVAYRKIFRVNEKAQFFTTWYVDAFAGSGSRSEPAQQARTEETISLFDDVYEDAESQRYKKGSAALALGLEDPFDRYLFIEKSRARVNDLEATIEREHPSLVPRCSVVPGDANEELLDWCARRNWKKERAVVFLDPYGLQVNWQTVETLAKTGGIDLWYLFPLGIGIGRLLTRNGEIHESWRKRLTVHLGTTDWKSHFYRVDVQEGLFGEVEEIARDASEHKLQAFIEDRLKSCFVSVAKGLILRNSRSSPLYLLCFAASSKVGAPTALKIAQHLLKE